MWLSVVFVISLSDNFSIFYNHSTYQRIRGYLSFSFLCQCYCSAHVIFICHFFSFFISDMASPYHKSPKQMLRASFYRVLLPGIYFQILLFIGNKKCSGNKFQSKHFNIHHNHSRVLVFLSFIFFHPDCTVGFGVSPNHALRLVGYTTGRELHPALKIFIKLSMYKTIIFLSFSVKRIFLAFYTASTV